MQISFGIILASWNNAKHSEEYALENEMKFLQMILPVEFDDEILRVLEEEDEDWDLAYAFNSNYPMN